MKGLHRIGYDLGLEGPRDDIEIGGPHDWLYWAEHWLVRGAEWRLEQESRVDDADEGLGRR